MSAFDSTPWLATVFPEADTALRAQEAAVISNPLGATVPSDFTTLVTALEAWRANPSWPSVLSESVLSHHALYIMQAQRVDADAVPVPTTDVVPDCITAGGFLPLSVSRPSSWYLTNTVAADLSMLASAATADANSLSSRVQASQSSVSVNILKEIFGNPTRPNPPIDTSKSTMRDLIFNQMGFATAFDLFSVPLPF